MNIRPMALSRCDDAVVTDSDIYRYYYSTTVSRAAAPPPLISRLSGGPDSPESDSPESRPTPRRTPYSPNPNDVCGTDVVGVGGS